MDWQERCANSGPGCEVGTDGRLRAVLRESSGRTGLVVGALIGFVVTALVAFVVVPLFDTTPPIGDDENLEPGKLVILSGRDQSSEKPRQALVEQWNRLHPDNQAEIIELPLEADKQYSEMVARAQSGAGVDVFNLDVAWTAEFADADYIHPLEESSTDTSGFLQRPLETCRYSGKLWALPFNTDAGLLYYRTDLLPRLQDANKSDKPRQVAWRDITAEIQRVFGEQHDDRLVAGYTGQLLNYEGLVVNAMEAIWAANGEVVDPNGEVVIDSREAETGLRRIAEGLRSSDPQVVLPEARRQDETSSMQAFRDGKVLFMRNWPVAYRNLTAQSRDASDAPGLPFQVAELPGPSVLGGQNLAVARASKKPHAARALIEFLTSPRSQQILFERGGFAATREIVYWDGEIKKRHPYADVLLEAIRDARPRPITPHYARFAEEFRGVVREALDNGGNLPDDAKDRLAAALRGQ